MPFRDSLQPNRFEFKYIVSEPCAAAVRDYSRSYLEPDPYADPEHGNSYLLASLYMDTPDLALYQQTVRGEKNRFKLRIRFYDDHPSSPALLEIKRRVTDVILKERAVVTRAAVREFLDDKAPQLAWLMRGTEDAPSGKAMLHFCGLVDRIGAGPSIYVVYRREAYVSPESNSVRVTFDRELLGGFYEPGTNLRLPTHGVRPDVGNGNKVILEFKFTDRFPEWLREVAQLFNLQRTSVPKYIHCIDKLGVKPGMLRCRGNGNGPTNHRPNGPMDHMARAHDEPISLAGS